MADIAGYEHLPGDELESNSHHSHHRYATKTTTPLNQNNNTTTTLREQEEALLSTELPLAWAAIQNLDVFLTRIYTYWEGKGFHVIIIARILNIAALAFTIISSGMLLISIDYSAFNSDCLKQGTCSLQDILFKRHPFSSENITWWTILSCIYLLLFTLYWLFSVVHLINECRDLSEVHQFYATHLGMSERAMRAATWPDVAARLVAAQQSTVRLSATCDLTEHDIVSIIMRRENYLIAMLNKGVLALNVPFIGFRKHILLTKTMEWNLYWILLDPLFEDHFRIKEDFIKDPEGLQRRLRLVAVVNAVLSPFLLVYLAIYFFMKNAETLYHHPSAIGARRWSPLARWQLREFNELSHFITHRLNAGHNAAERYVAQFPNYAISHVARFIAFVAGSFAAVLLALTISNERLLETDLLAGRQIVWWLALLGAILAISRSLIIEQSTSAFDPGVALVEVAVHTHYYPRHWHGRAHTVDVQEEFLMLFRYRFFLFLEELASVVLTPVLLWTSMPRCAHAVLDFVQENTVHVNGIGDICSYAAFDLRKHGNGRYGSPWTAPVRFKSRGGKMEKSVMSFAAAYPTWNPTSGDIKEMMETIATIHSKASLSTQSTSKSFQHLFQGQTTTLSSTMNHPPLHLYQEHPIINFLMSQNPHLAQWYLMQQYNTTSLYARSAKNPAIFKKMEEQEQEQDIDIGGVGNTCGCTDETVPLSADTNRHQRGCLDDFSINSCTTHEDERIVLGYTMVQAFHDEYTRGTTIKSGQSDDENGDDDGYGDALLETSTPISIPHHIDGEGEGGGGGGGQERRQQNSNYRTVLSNEMSVLSREPSSRIEFA